MGKSQVPFCSTVGLFIMMPSPMRLGTEKWGCGASGSSLQAQNTPQRPSNQV